MPAPLQYYRSLRSPKVIKEIRETLSRGPIVVPTIYLHGEGCACIAAEITLGQEGHFSALFEQVMLADAGHFVHLERPTVVNEAIVSWFRTH